jgi:hypothetical protein
METNRFQSLISVFSFGRRDSSASLSSFHPPYHILTLLLKSSRAHILGLSSDAKYVRDRTHLVVDLITMTLSDFW